MHLIMSIVVTGAATRGRVAYPSMPSALSRGAKLGENWNPLRYHCANQPLPDRYGI